MHLYRMEKTLKPKIESVVKPDNAELQKSQSYIVVEIIEYIPNSVVSKTIIKKSTGNVTAMSFDKVYIKKIHRLIFYGSVLLREQSPTMNTRRRKKLSKKAKSWKKK